MNKVKTYVIVGFLGSGKTTFLKNLPASLKKAKVAVIINEFGDKNLDGLVLKDFFPNLSEIEGGSIFCSCRTDQFVKVVSKLSQQDFDYIFIEGSGLANPGNILKVVDLIDQESNHRIDFKGVIGIVDPSTIYKIVETLNAAKNQLAFSDIILINKIDIATEEELIKAKDLIKKYNPEVLTFETTYSTLPFPIIEELVSLHDNRLGTTIMDIGIQQFSIPLPQVSVKQIKDICLNCVKLVDRIKGVVRLDETNYFFEYVNQALVFTKILSDVENYMVFLSTSKKDIKPLIHSEIKKVLEG